MTLSNISTVTASLATIALLVGVPSEGEAQFSCKKNKKDECNIVAIGPCECVTPKT
ncbi:MAG: hypothetical protein IT352_17145 [Gemmatimonadales bacterium]|nr:hypothetical protein [Gemmatimonadales bacterium]